MMTRLLVGAAALFMATALAAPSFAQTADVDRPYFRMNAGSASDRETGPSIAYAAARGKVGVPLSVSPVSRDMAEPIAWSLNQGVLPPGVSFDAATGRLSGAPTVAGVFPLKIVAAGSDGSGAAADVAVTVVEFEVAYPQGAVGVVGQPLAVVPLLSNARQPVLFERVSGQIPTGMALSPTGVVTGTPAAPGLHDGIVVRATDADGAVSQAAFTISVAAGSDLQAAVDATNVRIRVGTPVSITGVATGAKGDVAWAIANGQLPTGLILDPATGVVSGAPTIAGAKLGVTLQARDSAGAIANAPPVQIDVIGLPIASADQVYVATENQALDITPRSANILGLTSWAIENGSLPPTISVSPSTGKLTGSVPSPATIEGVRLRVTDTFDGRSGVSEPFTVQIDPTPQAGLAIVAMSSAQRMRAGVAFAGPAPSVVYGAAPFAWSKAGDLPPGLEIVSATGQVVGIPSSTGLWRGVTLTVRDQTAARASSRPVDYTVYPELAVTGLPDAVAAKVGHPVLIEPGLTGQMGGARWEILSGSLPAGLTLDAGSGRISGRPIEIADPSSVVLRVTDNGDGAVATSQTIAVSVSDGLIVTGPTSLNGRVGDPLTAVWSATRAVGPVVWSVDQGSLPDGLSVDPSSGALAGAPHADGRSNSIVVQARDSRGLTGVADPLSISVRGLLSAYLPANNGARVGAFAKFTPSTSNATGVVTWSVAEGGLPPGLNFHAPTGQITGVPTQAGTFSNIRLRAADGRGATALTQSATITVASAMTISNIEWIQDVRVNSSYVGPAPTVTGASGKVTFSIAPKGSNFDGTLAPDPDTGAIRGIVKGGTGYVRATDETGTNVDSNLVRVYPEGRVFWNGGGGTYGGQVGLALTTDETALFNTLGTKTVTAAPGYSIPTWLTLNESTVAMHGVPPGPGTWTFRLRGTDSWDGSFADTSLYTLVVGSPQPEPFDKDVIRLRSGSPSDQQVLATPGDFQSPVRATTNIPYNPTNITLPQGKPGHIGGYGGRAGFYDDLWLRLTDATGKVAEKRLALDIANKLQMTRGLPSRCMRTGRFYDIPGPSPVGVRGTPTVTNHVSYLTAVETRDPPTGMTLDPLTGRFYGVPTAAYDVDLRLKVTDSWDGRSEITNPFNFNVMPPMAPYLSGGPNFTTYTGLSFSTYFRGFETSYEGARYSLVSGALPPEFKMGYRIEGTSYTPGVYKFRGQTLDVCDGETGVTPETTITVVARLWAQAPATLYATAGQPYRSEAPVAHYPKGVVTWTRNAGTLPAGLTVDPASGQVVGTTTVAGTYSGIVLRATDKGDNNRTANTQPLKIIVQPAPLVNVEDEYRAYVGLDFALAPSAQGLAGSLTWTLTGGALPAGLSLSPETGAITGTPVETGVSEGLVLAVTDRAGATVSSAAFRIRVIDLDAPESDVVSVAGVEPVSVHWTTGGVAYESQPAWAGTVLDLAPSPVSQVKRATFDGVDYLTGDWAGAVFDDARSYVGMAAGEEILIDYGRKVSAIGWEVSSYTFGYRGYPDVEAFYEMNGSWVPFGLARDDYSMFARDYHLRGTGGRVIAQRFRLRMTISGMREQVFAVRVFENPPPHSAFTGSWKGPIEHFPHTP